MSMLAGQIKLIKPLFINGMFNREGKRIRAKYTKTISNDNVVFPLWISAGKSDKDYTSDENDQYYLMIEKNGYLISCGYTEKELEERSGYECLIQNWYGDSGKREKYFKENIYKGHTSKEYEPLVKQQVIQENAFILEHGKDGTVQAAFLKKGIDKAVENYINARDNNGMFADFVGACWVGELETCDKLAQRNRKIREQEEARRHKQYEEQRKQEIEEQKKEEQIAIEKAEDIFKNGGTITDGKIIIKLADKYNIDIPIRTKGWILSNLSECTILNNGSINYRYWKRTKGAKGSQKVYDILFAIRNVLGDKQAYLA